MDYAGQALILRRPGAVQPAGTMAAPLWLAPDHFIFSQGSVGKAGPGPVLVDTGGAGLGVVLTEPQAAAAGITVNYGKPGTDLGVTAYPCAASVTLGRAVRRDMPGAAGPVQSPAELGFSYLGTLSHEFFKPLCVTFDFSAMATFIAAA